MTRIIRRLTAVVILTLFGFGATHYAAPTHQADGWSGGPLLSQTTGYIR